METENEFEGIEKVLDGSAGVVYLMFLGRETYAAAIQHPLVKSEFYSHKESVNQTFERLVKEEYGSSYLRFVEERRAAGKPKIYTANYDPIFITLREFDIKFDEGKLKSIFTKFSFLNDNFPVYLIKQFQNKTSFHKKLRWRHTLSNYLLYLAFFHLLPHPIFKKLGVEDEKLKSLYSSLTSERFKIRPNIGIDLEQKIKKFLVRYPGGEASFVEDVYSIMFRGSFEMLLGPLAKQLLGSFESLAKVLDS